MGDRAEYDQVYVATRRNTIVILQKKMLLVTDNSGVAFEPSEKMDNFVDIQMLFSGLKKSLMHGFGPKP